MKKILLSFVPMLVALVLIVSPSVGFSQTDDDVEDALAELRAERQAFKEAKAQERQEATEERRATVQAKREAAKQKREEAQQRREEKRKMVLLKLIDVQIKHYNKTNERVQRMPNITNELKAQLATEIDTMIQELHAQKVKVESTTGRDAIKELAKEIRTLFKSKREMVKNIVDAIHSSRANKAVAKAEERAAAIKEKVKELKDEGKDTTELETELEDAEEDIDNAQEATGRQAFREANENLKGAYQKFKDIAQKSKGL